MLRSLLIALVILTAAIMLAIGGVRGMSDGGLRHSAGTLSHAISADAVDGMSDGGLALHPEGMSDGGL